MTLFHYSKKEFLTDLEAEINLVDFHKRRIGPGHAHHVSGLNSLECVKRILLS